MIILTFEQFYIMGDCQDPTSRLRSLADAASDFRVDQNIPIRRYFRSGQEMIKMAEVYRKEGNLEAAYVLYLKYITLFVEKLKRHRDYHQIIPAEKEKVSSIVRDAMNITENLKKSLRARFEEEYRVWLHEEDVRRLERERLEEEERARRAEIEAGIESDRQVAMWHQAQIDQEERTRRGLGHMSVSGQISLEQPRDPASASAPPPLYSDLVPEGSSLPGQSAATPQFDRSSKPVAAPGPSPSSVITAATLPSVPDRSLKPASESSTGLRTVTLPGDLISRFLAIAKVNSDRGIETLGTFGGQLCKNRFLVTHLLIPRQVGKSDSCTMDGLEDVWEIHDKENIIFLGWIHTHPAYSVFLSSVDMHNQYEWQHMLPEAIATVCSIKDGVTGHLRLTQAGMAEIGDCSLTNFHPHSKQPPLWTEADHVATEAGSKVIIKDLR